MISLLKSFIAVLTLLFRKYAKFYNLLEIPLIDLINNLGYKIDQSKITNNPIEYSDMFNNFINERKFHLEQKDISIFSNVFKKYHSKILIEYKNVKFAFFEPSYGIQFNLKKKF